MIKFSERLLQAARYAGVGESQAAIAKDLGLDRQTVNHWFRNDATPGADNLALVQKKWGVNAEWLRSGDGGMLASPDALPEDEVELLKDYRRASTQTREHIRTVVRALRKSVVTLAAVIPPLMAPSPADAAICHNHFSRADVIRIAWRRWIQVLARLMAARVDLTQSA